MTLYDVLGVQDEADLEEIKRAYYDRARLYHPDAHAASSPSVRAEAERTMQALNQAWSVLRDASLRRRYDRSLRDSQPTRSRRRSTASGGGTATATRPVRRPAARRAALGVGFQYWFGSGTTRRGGRPTLNLRVTGSSLAALRSLVPDGLTSLHAEHRPVDDIQLRNLQGMQSLRYVDLTGTRVTDAGLVHLLASQELETLVLWDTAVTDDGLALLARFPSLCHLGLGNTAVTDTGLRHLAGLRRLRLLQLTGTEVAGPGLRHLHALPELMSVSIPWRVRGSHRRRLRAALPPGAQVL